MNTQSNYLITAVVAVVVGAGAFFGGVQYQMRQRPAMSRQRVMTGMAPVSGEIISQDDTSITVKMPDGSSKIVIVSDQTTVNTSSEGAKTDLKTGEQVTAFGIQNQDGSMTAQSVSVGGGMMFRGMGGQGPSSAPTAQ